MENILDRCQSIIMRNEYQSLHKYHTVNKINEIVRIYVSLNNFHNQLNQHRLKATTQLLKINNMLLTSIIKMLWNPMRLRFLPLMIKNIPKFRIYQLWWSLCDTLIQLFPQNHKINCALLNKYDTLLTSSTFYIKVSSNHKIITHKICSTKIGTSVSFLYY